MVDEPQPADTATPAPAAPAEPATPAPAEAPAARPSVLSDAEDVAPAAADAPAEPDAPAPVEYAIKLPEGFEANETVTAFTELAKTANIPLETAQQIMDMHIASQQHWQDGLEAQRLEVFGEWYNQTKADPEIGGKQMAVVGKRVSALIKTNITGDAHKAEVDFLLKDMGLDSHPGFIRLMDNIAKKFAETPLGNDVSSAPAAGFEPQKIWPGMNP